MKPLSLRSQTEQGPNGQLSLTALLSDHHDAELCTSCGVTVSRRKFVGQAAIALGSVLAAGLWLPKQVQAADATPKPIRGGIKFPLTGRFIHHYPIERGRQPSEIGDFNGFVGFAKLSGTGTGFNKSTGATTPLLWGCDNGFMKGIYIGVDGNQYRGTFGFI